MGGHVCPTHSRQGFVICCDHVCDEIEAHRVGAARTALRFEIVDVGGGYRFVRCMSCTAAGVTYDLTQPAPAAACSACFDAWRLDRSA
jgi:hypothetical protein